MKRIFYKDEENPYDVVGSTPTIGESHETTTPQSPPPPQEWRDEEKPYDTIVQPNPTGDLTARMDLPGRRLNVASTGAVYGGQSDFNTGTGFFLGNYKGVPVFSIGEPSVDSSGNTIVGNQYLTCDGTTLEYTGASRSLISYSTIFENSSRFGQNTTGTGAISFDEYGLLMETGATANSMCHTYIHANSVSAVPSFAPFVDSSIVVSFLVRSGTISTARARAFFGVREGAGAMDGTTIQLDGIDHYGFYIYKSSGESGGQVWATSGNASGSIETTYLSNLAFNDDVVGTAVLKTNYEEDGDPSGNAYVKFTLNDGGHIYTATHTTQIPSTGTDDYVGSFIVNNNNTAYNFSVEVNQYSYEKFTSLSR
jgi:hypothetical protein